MSVWTMLGDFVVVVVVVTMHVLKCHAPYGDLQCTDTVISGL